MKRSLSITLCFILMLGLVLAWMFKPRMYRLKTLAMGTYVHIEMLSIPYLVDMDRVIRELTIESDRLDKVLSPWQGGSQVSIVNSNAGISPVMVSPVFYKLLKELNIITNATQGAFHYFDSNIPLDIAKQFEFNDAKNEVFIKSPDVQLNLRAVEKGFLADRLLLFLKRNGVHNALINVGDYIYRTSGKRLLGHWGWNLSFSEGKKDLETKQDGAWVHVLKDLVIVSPSGVLSNAVGSCLKKIHMEDWIDFLNTLDQVDYYWERNPDDIRMSDSFKKYSALK